MVGIKMTEEQLKSLNLTEEQIKSYLSTINESNGGNRIPFVIAKVFYDVDIPELRGTLVGGVEKDDEGNIVNIKYKFGDKPEMRILKAMCQYTEYDPEVGKVIISSNILPLRQSRKAVDLRTGKLISELKPTHPNLKYQMVVLASIKEIETGEWIPCVMYLKGRFLYEFNNEVKQSDYLVKKIKFTLKRNKKGSIIFYIPTDFEITPLSNEEIFNNIANDAEQLEKFDLWIKSVNSMLYTDNEIDDDITKEVYNNIFEEN